MACGLGVIQTRTSGAGATDETGIVLNLAAQQVVSKALIATIQDR
jgi:hypothetical protein